MAGLEYTTYELIFPHMTPIRIAIFFSQMDDIIEDRLLKKKKKKGNIYYKCHIKAINFVCHIDQWKSMLLSIKPDKYSMRWSQTNEMEFDLYLLKMNEIVLMVAHSECMCVCVR